ncbi:hypothetical protein CYMTET_53292 [Cymbomonas tetramitiformis]|uniref:Uncharacterized protein n=1 Tax=Cymbomonas tetramitiformis TaxID=36881 RepID=A0AAE0BH72_9CHLO|nr:hypothetical protein CYMTET_53292 [Cymbomonas tetramitiformis]
MPFCENPTCMKERARHWHRDCPNGGRQGTRQDSLHYFSSDDMENDVYAMTFQAAIDNNNSDKFDALCVLAGGKPDIVTDISACSFCEAESECLVSAVDEYIDMAQQSDGVVMNINTFTARVGEPQPVVASPQRSTPATSVASEDIEWTGPQPSHPLMPHPITRTFADFISAMGFTVGGCA